MSVQSTVYPPVERHMNPKDWIINLIALRRGLISRKISQKNPVECFRVIKQFEDWISAHKPTRDQMISMLRRHRDSVHLLMPGRESQSYSYWKESFESILNSQQ